MKVSSLKIYLFIALFFCLMGVTAESVSAFQTQTVSANELRRLFTKAVGQEFEIVKDEMKHRPRDTAADYWLVYVKPKRSGRYTLKYSYKLIKKWSESSTEEGENEFSIGVGEKKCHRLNTPESGISNFCLGDTIIIPILTTNLTGHTFNLKFYEQKPESLEETKKYKSQETYSSVEPQFNQLNANVKLLGTRRYEMPHRNCCPVTVEYYAVFEAVKPGRFNLGLSSFKGDEKPDNSLKMNATDGAPIIIVAPGTPITALLSTENTIHYSDNRRFSAHAGNSFLTNLLIFQPGDVFALRYSRYTVDYGFRTKVSERPKIFDIKPAVYKLPFMLNKDWSFNEWLANDLPKNNCFGRDLLKKICQNFQCFGVNFFNRTICINNTKTL